MPAVQTTYNDRMKAAVAGMLADMQNWNGMTRSCETAAGISFGVAVGLGADAEKGCVLGGALVGFLGVAFRDITLEARTTIDKYAETENVGICDEGTVWVQVSDTPDPTDPVHYDATTGVFKSTGGNGPVRGARWVGSPVTDPNGVSICKLRLGNRQAAA